MIRLKRLYANNLKQLQDLELHFPDHARILVQGKNEAGKSTLFEAVFFALFGGALATEAGARGLEDLIRYGVEKARVELDVAFGARLFKITRTLARGKANTWELDIARDGEPPEEIRGNTAVNKRLVAELGFDGEALLNTCFVEQKKLEKLEGLSKAKREESLAKLLNLDALVQLENDLKIRAEDRQALERLERRAELADIQAELPAREQDLHAVESKLKFVELRGALGGATTEMRAVQQLDAAIQSLTAQRDAAAQRVERIEALREAMQNVKEARDAVERVAENAREVERLRMEQAEHQRAADEAPQLQARANALRRLTRRLQRLDGIRAARAANAQRAAQLASIAARLDDLRATVTREEQSLAQVETRLRAHEVSAALGAWLAARQVVAARDEIESAVKTKQAARDKIAHGLRNQVYRLTALTVALIAAAAIAPSAWLVFALLALAALTLVVLAVRATTLWRDLARASEEVGQAEGEARARAAASEAQVVRLQEAEQSLARLDVAVPASPDAAQARRAEIAREIAGKTEEELRAEENATRERLLNARAVLGELQRQNDIEDAAGLQRERETRERAAQKADRILTAWQARAQTAAAALGVELDAGAIQRARYQMDAQVEQTQRRAREATRLTQEIARREQQAQALWARARDVYEKARARTDAPAWHPSLGVEDYTRFGKELRAEYDALGGEAAVRQAREVEGELGRRQGERGTRAQNVALLLARARQLLAEIGVPNELPAAAELPEVKSLHARLQVLDLGDEATLHAQQRELVGRVRSLRDRQTQLERELGLAGEWLDRAACRAEYAAKAREARVRERGVEIVALARRRIVQKVLPATMDYMRRILPALTRDRYHDTQLDPESYRIQVWDERGGAFKEKNIFSGGTKDQFSLALRLAFALATLPQERGAAPSFIFLDEPLGSFDDERADALIYLLTEGEIARAFDQIFLISHVHVDERLFTHRVVLENGRVVETDLPTSD